MSRFATFKLAGFSALCLTALNPTTALAFGEDEFLPAPANAKPGECYTRTYLKAQYSTVDEKILVQEPARKFEITPPVYQTVNERVLISEGSKRMILVDSEGVPLPKNSGAKISVNAQGHLEIVGGYKRKVTKRVLVKPAYEKVIAVAPTFKTIKDRILVQPARTGWKLSKANDIYGPAVARRNGAPVTRINQTTGEVMCLVKIPATYKTVLRKVVSTPAATRVVNVSAEYKTIVKTVTEPVSIKEITTGPVYAEYTKKVLAQPGEQREINVPAKYMTVSKKVLSREEGVQWVSVLCQANITKDKIKEVQLALKKRGEYRGPIDGLIGGGTMRAITAYQKKKRLIEAGLTIETLTSLGVVHD